jgi:predicted dehydrogenase
MKKDKVLVGVIGAGFGQKGHIPGFEACPDAEMVAICDKVPEIAEGAAQKFDIPYVFTDYQEMLQMEELDLVSVATPPYLHYPMVMAVLEAGKHILCEKPMALNTMEAREMYRRAEEAGVVHLIDHELRFNPTRVRMKELIDDGFIGHLRHVMLTTVTNFQTDPFSSPWNWWSQRDKGGGRLGADGSHQIDQLRWWFGEIEGVFGRGHTFVKERKLPDSSEMRPVETDDFTSLLILFASGAEGVLSISSVASHVRGNRVEAYGGKGSLILDAEGRLWGARKGEADFKDLSVPDPLASVEGVSKNVWTRSFAHLAKYLVDVIRTGGAVEKGATFYDGMRCQEVMDAARRSWEEERWVEINGGLMD